MKEKANCLRTEMIHLWGAMFITGGGAVGFSVVENKSISTIFFMILGYILSVVFINAYIIRRNQLLNLTRLLKEDEKNGKNI